MAHIKMYSTSVCPFCIAAEKLLISLGHEVQEKILIDTDDEKREEMIRITESRSVPQIFINEKHVGGFQELLALMRTGELDDWVA